MKKGSRTAVATELNRRERTEGEMQRRRESEGKSPSRAAEPEGGPDKRPKTGSLRNLNIGADAAAYVAPYVVHIREISGETVVCEFLYRS